MQRAQTNSSPQPPTGEAFNLEVRTFQSAELLLDGEVISVGYVDGTREQTTAEQLPPGVFNALLERGAQNLESERVYARDREVTIGISGTIIGGMTVATCYAIEAANSAESFWASITEVTFLGSGLLMVFHGLRFSYKSAKNRSKRTSELQHKIDVLNSQG